MLGEDHACFKKLLAEKELEIQTLTELIKKTSNSKGINENFLNF